MIDFESIKKEWIEDIAKKKKADKILIEKVNRALMLLEGLSISGLNFVFKGGTALMLLLGTTKRLSIDIDIIVPDKNSDITSYLDKFIIEKGFIRYEKQERTVESDIEKEHYKLFFISALNNKESHILLDVLKENIHYKTLVETPVSSSFLKETGEPVQVTTPDFNNILGDKLTAFAPKTTGIPYYKKNKEMGMEIIKQMYDIGCLFDKIDDIEIVNEVFNSFASIELKYRGNKNTISDVQDDIFYTSLAICLRKNTKDSNFDVLNRGITSVKSYIFSDSFHLDKAIVHAAKAAYLATLIKYHVNEIIKYDTHIDKKSWEIKFPVGHPLNDMNKLNKLKKSNIEAFHYWYQTYKIISGKK